MNKAKFSSSELNKSIKSKVESLAQQVDLAVVSEQMQEYLKACSKFHQYSYNNILLIWMSNPNATAVAGYKRWLELNRYVKRGEKGIPILAPCLYRVDTEDPDNKTKELRGFRVVYVFDISQTDGEPLPKTPDWKSPEKNQELNDMLIQYAQSKGITVSIKKQSDGAQGVSKGGEIELDPSAGTKTLVHEIAHELMHRDKDRTTDKTIRELEAESVAFVVCSHFGLEVKTSPNYVSLHGATSDLILSHLDRIRTTAAEIIQAIGVPEV